MTLKGSGNAIAPSDNLKIDGSIVGNKFEKMFGVLNLGTISSELDSVQLTIFNAATQCGTFSIVGADIKMRFDNSFGLPLKITFDTLMGVNPNTGIVHDISNSVGIPNPFVLPFPSISSLRRRG